ncbi:MAG TPA: energy transducer TonB [Candidatus Acidoferrales bacterium]|jgi:protein TonB|nr:energy transducer TonB [Candidatus Acidoferrales bacterium]
MPFLMPQSSSGNSEQSSSWLRRVSENIRLALSLPHTRLHSANGAPAPFSSVETSTRYGSAQGISAFAHVAILGGLLLVLASTTGKVPGLNSTPLGGPDHEFRFFPPPELKPGTPSLGLRGSSSGNESELARKGNLVPPSSMPLAPPRLTHSDHEELPVAPAMFDPNAPAAVPIITDLGLPWMNRDTNSAGRDKGHGIGNHSGNGMGDDDGNGAGAGDTEGNYANAVSQPACLHCPEPPYTDEARKAKLQGSVTLRVLISADGRALRIQVVKGLGSGLDEQAVQAIRAWHFAPARDARRQPVPTWVTIETRFQLL